MASRKQRKKKAKARAHAAAPAKPAKGLRNDRQSPVQAIESKHAELAAWLERRPDRFSQLLAKSIRDERAGQHLVTRSGLSADERDELAALREQAHVDFRTELIAAIAH